MRLSMIVLGIKFFSEKRNLPKEEERQLDKRMHTDSDIQQVFIIATILRK